MMQQKQLKYLNQNTKSKESNNNTNTLNTNKEMKKNADRFLQGYLCALSMLLQKEGGASTQARELLKEGGGYNLGLWHKCGIDENDIEVFKKYRKQLI